MLCSNSDDVLHKRTNRNQAASIHLKTTDMDCLQFPTVPPQEIVDWAYVMRREMQEILPHLYLGPYAAAKKSKLNSLKQNRITDIICIRHTAETHFIRPNFPEHFRYLVLDIADEVTQNIIQYVPMVKQFLDESLERNGRALVHGNAGISRSAALVIAYIMEKYGLTYKEAFFYVQQKRFCINPNEGFVQQLTEYEAMYRARMFVEKCGTSSNNSLLKRKSPDDRDDQDDGKAMFPT